MIVINKFGINYHFNFKWIFIISLILKIKKRQKIYWINVDEGKTYQNFIFLLDKK